MGLDAKAAEVIFLDCGFWVVDVEDLMGVGGQDWVVIDEEQNGGGEGVEILGVGEVDGFGEGGEEAAVLALADEDFAEDFPEVASGGNGMSGEQVLFQLHRWVLG